MGGGTDLLQADDERLGTLDLIDLPGFTHGLLDDVAVVVVILETRRYGGSVFTATLTIKQFNRCHPSKLRLLKEQVRG